MSCTRYNVNRRFSRRKQQTAAEKRESELRTRMRINMLSQENLLPVTVAFQDASMLKVPNEKFTLGSDFYVAYFGIPEISKNNGQCRLKISKNIKITRKEVTILISFFADVQTIGINCSAYLN